MVRIDKIKKLKSKADLVKAVKEMRAKGFHLAAMVPLLEQGRLSLIYFFLLKNEHEFLSVDLDAKHPHMDSVIEIYPNANSFELESRDLFGIWFDGNKDMEKRFFLAEKFDKVPFKDVPFKDGEKRA
jgi:NADH:ubiquinone oxidoreductase subunit C